VKSQATLKSVPKVKGTKVASKAKKKSQLYKGSKPKSPAFHCTKEVPPAVYGSKNGKPLDINGEPLDGYFEELTALQLWNMAKSWLFWKGGTVHSDPS
jgi:hypothetical protein